MVAVVEEQRRLDDINYVFKERESLEKAAEDYITLLGTRKHDDDEARRLILQISQHLGNMGGFCNNGTKKAIMVIQLYLGASMIMPTDRELSLYLMGLLPLIIGIQVDYTKRPFKVVGISFEALNTKFKALLKK